MANVAAPPVRPPVAPPRPQVGPPAPRPQIGPPAPQVPQVPQVQNVQVPAPVAPQPQVPVVNLAPPAPQQAVLPTGGDVAGAVPTRKRRTSGRKATNLPQYYGLFVYGEDGNPVMVVGADGSQYPQRQKLTAVPTDFEPAKSAKLKPSDFDSELVFMEFQIAQTKAKLAGMEARYETIKKLGVGTGAKAASNLLKYQKQFAGLRAQLEAQGINVDDLLAAGLNC